MVVLKPRRTAPRAPTVCTLLHTLSHLRQNMHLSIFLMMEGVSSFFLWDSSPPLNGIWVIFSLVTRAWSSHSPHLGQVRQSFGWSERISSAIVLRALMTLIELVLTTMSGIHLVAHAGARLRRPWTSTTQSLQDAGRFFTHVPLRSMWQSVGILIPIDAAASRIIVSLGTETWRLSMVRLMFSIIRQLL